MDQLPRPMLRSLIVCDRVETDPRNHKRLNVFGIVTNLRMTKFPGLAEELHILALLSDCRGQGTGYVEIVHADSETTILRTVETPIRFGGDPLMVHGVRTKLQECVFGQPGLHWVRFVFDNQLLGETPIVLK
jgi:hypothetical protein